VIESLDSQPCFTRELLNEVPFLDEGQKDQLYPMMTELPGRLAALDQNADKSKKKRKRRRSRSKQSSGPRLGKQSSTLTGERYEVNYDLVITDLDGGMGQVSEQLHYRVVEFGESGLAVVGPENISEQSIHKFRLETEHQLYDFWGTVTLVSPGDEPRVEIQPIGVSGVTTEKWLRTVTRSKQGGITVPAPKRTQCMQAVELVQPAAPGAERLSSRSRALLGSFELSENWS